MSSPRDHERSSAGYPAPASEGRLDEAVPTPVEIRTSDHQPIPHTELHSETDLSLPTPSRTVRLFGRALRVRCPNCGKGPVLVHWLRLRVKCGTCGLRLQRGEHDTIMGSVFTLFTLVGLAAYAAMVLAMTLTETTPWDLLETGLPLLTVVLVLVLFPVSKLLWLAFDLTLRPATPAELAWHRASTSEFETERDAPRSQ